MEKNNFRLDEYFDGATRRLVRGKGSESSLTQSFQLPRLLLRLQVLEVKFDTNGLQPRRILTNTAPVNPTLGNPKAGRVNTPPPPPPLQKSVLPGTKSAPARWELDQDRPAPQRVVPLIAGQLARAAASLVLNPFLYWAVTEEVNESSPSLEVPLRVRRMGGEEGVTVVKAGDQAPRTRFISFRNRFMIEQMIHQPENLRTEAQRESYRMILAVLLTINSRHPLHFAIRLQTGLMGAFVGGRSAKKSIAAHVQHSHVSGEPLPRELFLPPEWNASVLAELNRELSRGGGISSQNFALVGKRIEKGVVGYGPHSADPKIEDWFDFYVQRQLKRTPLFCSCGKRSEKGLFGYCRDCLASELNVIQSGGATICATRSEGGSHAAFRDLLLEMGFDLLQSPDLDQTISMIKKILHHPKLVSAAIFVTVYPPGTDGPRDQETPSLLLAVASLVVRCAFRQLIDPKVVITNVDPSKVRQEANLGHPSVRTPLLAIDATRATDGLRTELLERVLAQLLKGTPFEDCTQVLTEATFRYSSRNMTPYEWARRLTPNVVVEFNTNPSEYKKIFIEVDPQTKIETSAGLVITGGTGSGKTVRAPFLRHSRNGVDWSQKVVVVLPTITAIKATAEYQSTIHPTIPFDTIYFEAGDQDTGIERYLGQSRTPRAFSDGVADVVFATPFQARVRVELAGHLVVIDEAHDLDVNRCALWGAMRAASRNVVLVTATPTAWIKNLLKEGTFKEHQYPSNGTKKSLTARSSSILPGRKLVIGAGILHLKKLAQEAGDSWELIHGYNSPEVNHAHIMSGKHIFATIGIAANSITIPGVVSVTVDPSCFRPIRFRIGDGFSQAADVRTVSKGVLEQLAGRAGRGDVVRAELVLPHIVGSVSGSSWNEVIDKIVMNGVTIQEVPPGWCNATLFDQASVIGDLPDPVAIETLRVLSGGSAGALPLLRATHQALLSFFTQPLATVRKSEIWPEIAAGMDPALLNGEVRYLKHRAISEETAPLTPNFCLGVLFRTGTFLHHESTSICRAVAALVPRVPIPEKEVPNFCFIDGSREECCAPGVVGSGTSVASREAAIVGTKTRKNTAGIAMGSNANGGVLNGIISGCAAIADAAVVAMKELRFLAKTGGDDGICSGEPTSVSAHILARAAAGMETSSTKTVVTGFFENGRTVLLPEGTYRASFLENYLDPISGGIQYPTPWLAITEVAARLVGGENLPDPEYINRTGLGGLVRALLGCDPSAFKNLSRIAFSDRRPVLARTLERVDSSESKSHDVVLIEEIPGLRSLLRIPSRAGKQAGKPLYSKLLSIVIESRNSAPNSQLKCPICSQKTKICRDCKIPHCEECLHVCPEEDISNHTPLFDNRPRLRKGGEEEVPCYLLLCRRELDGMVLCVRASQISGGVVGWGGHAGGATTLVSKTGWRSLEEGEKPSWDSCKKYGVGRIDDSGRVFVPFGSRWYQPGEKEESDGAAVRIPPGVSKELLMSRDSGAASAALAKLRELLLTGEQVELDPVFEGELPFFSHDTPS